MTDSMFNPEGVDAAFLYCFRHDLFTDMVGRSFKYAYEHGACDSEIAAWLFDRMHRHQRDVDRGIVAPFKLPKLAQGPLILGHAWDAPEVIYRVPVNYLAGNTLVTGSSGSGKTLRAYFAALLVASLLDATWMVDLRKKEFRRLRGAFRRMGKRLICVDARRMKLNPLQPPVGVDPRNWAPQVADLLVQVLHLPPRASTLTATLIHHLYKDAEQASKSSGGTSGGSGGSGGGASGGGGWPTLYCLLEAARHAKDANAQSRMALVDNLESLLLSAGLIFAYHTGWTTHDLCKHSLAFELDGVSDVVKDLILNSLVLGEFTSRIARGVSNPDCPNLWVCLDEANRLAAGSDAGQFGLSSLISVVRGTGIALDLSCQTAQLDPQILANTATKIVGRTSYFPDLQVMGRAMGLTSEQTQYLTHKLQPGKFAMQLGDGDWRHPFLIQIPHIDLAALDRLNDGIDADDLGPLAALPTIPRKYPRKHPRPQNPSKCPQDHSAPTTAPPPEVRPEIRPETSKPAAEAPPPQAASFDSDAEARLMKIIADQPFIALRDLIAAAKMSSKTVARLRKNLVAKQYIRERDIHHGGPGRSALHLEALDAGRQAVTDHFGSGGPS